MPYIDAKALLLKCFVTKKMLAVWTAVGLLQVGVAFAKSSRKWVAIIFAFEKVAQCFACNNLPQLLTNPAKQQTVLKYMPFTFAKGHLSLAG